jgi:PAS domain S-box-containing protein
MTQKKILIVEDETVNAMDIEDTLGRNGYLVAGVASNGVDAIRIAKDTYPDLILMDIRIEGSMDGIEVANHINLYYEIPIIFLTAYSDDLTISRAVKAKSFSFLLKPFNERELISNIEMAINKNLSFQKSMAAQRIMESMFDLMSECILSTDADGIILRINPATEKMTTFKREDVAGMSFREIISIPPEHTEMLAALVSKAQRSGDTLVYWPYPVSILSRSGEMTPMDLTLNLLMLPNSTLSEIIYILVPKKQG